MDLLQGANVSQQNIGASPRVSFWLILWFIFHFYRKTSTLNTEEEQFLNDGSPLNVEDGREVGEDYTGINDFFARSESQPAASSSSAIIPKTKSSIRKPLNILACRNADLNTNSSLSIEKLRRSKMST